MKFWYKFLFLPILILALIGCSDDREFENLYHPKVLPPEDGVVRQLQKHTLGNGVPIVIMGDRFLDYEIKMANIVKLPTGLSKEFSLCIR